MFTNNFTKRPALDVQANDNMFVKGWGCPDSRLLVVWRHRFKQQRHSHLHVNMHWQTWSTEHFLSSVGVQATTIDGDCTFMFTCVIHGCKSFETQPKPQESSTKVPEATNTRRTKKTSKTSASRIKSLLPLPVLQSFVDVNKAFPTV